MEAAVLFRSRLNFLVPFYTKVTDDETGFHIAKFMRELKSGDVIILFAPHAFAPQRQLMSSRPPSPLVFLRISTHFTATHGIPPASPSLKTSSFESSLWVKPIDFTSNLPARLRALYTQ